MTETLGAAQTDDPAADPPAPHRTVRVVIDGNDDPGLSRRLAALEAAERIVVRPNPVRSPNDLVWDILAGAGKNPAAVRTCRLSIADAWKAATAWITAAHVTDILVERAHRLSSREALQLAELADRADADLWLIWSGGGDPARMCNAIESLGRSERKGAARGHIPFGAPHRPVRAMGGDTFERVLPLPAPALSLPLHPDEHADPDADWPALPTVDFPLFLASCRRRLAGDTFEQIHHAYRTEAQATDAFVRRHRNDLAEGRTGNAFKLALNAYLRDERLGPATGGRLALIRLRAIQASLLTRGILLRWQSTAFGPAAADKLTTWLTPGICRALRATVSTHAAAATVLSLHLAAAPDRFSHLLCRNIDEAGRYLYLPTFEDAALYLRADWAHQLDRRPEDECPSYGHTTGKTPLPPYAAELLAAHLAHRRTDGSGTRRRYLADPKNPTLDASDRSLVETIQRTCRRIGVNPFWLHRGMCEVSGIGGGPAPLTDWMAARRMDVVLLSEDGPDR
ncbi:hypothetical protein AQF52_2642 [Streptomyces venezuelae]|uniref:hypothetical protein n=1 Tax=Streptomyces TaxID=1883 RepID=UPI0006BC805E|nr:hypothetical protein [Streptomyces gardneri]ALO08237.1 hypothetical protein AQF52_2642 [Streptomyces venezuelae]QPK45475.1 hypothetical protein H4W23_13100 [Streptomyces gardneri]WRK36811.1 hypothetical protein U0M97_13165 [Streptomyces venezuelae]CUM41409.1 hypothetical protein BN2537_11783 [Streptomyces venezuelae]